MVMNRKPLAAVAVGALLVSVAGCGGGSSDSNGNDSAAGTKGGTLYHLTERSVERTDPSRLYVGRDIFNFSRTVYRSWVTAPVTTDEKEAATVVPDLATDTGTANADKTVWKFTLRDGVKWEDGKDITCEDFKYGVSRNFATNLDGGPKYAVDYLDIPKKADGTSTYAGPFRKTGQAAFDKAVTCKGKTITYRFNKTFPDLPLAMGQLLMFNPFRKDKDLGEKSALQIFSNGPYKLQGKWRLNGGGTLVRNDQWDAKTDSIRKALPDEIVFQEGVSKEVINQRLISSAGKDANVITDRVIPPSLYSQIVGPVKERATLTDSPFVYYLVPNFNRMKNLKVRQALLASTNSEGWRNAEGGTKAAKPADSLINPTLPGYKPNPEFDYPDTGDVTTAKKLLKESGEKLPYPLKFTYQGGTPTSDKAAAALAATWKQAGFKVTLDPLTDTYYSVIQKPTADGDVFWAGWAPDWTSSKTVLPPLFDSRTNLTPESNNSDYGNYRSDAVNKAFDKAAAITDIEEQGAAYAAIDEMLAKEVAYIPLEINQFYFLHGSKVTGYINNPATSNYADLAAIGVAK
jgi:peptide/nickel transport system substrate-binding protein